jgi:hypothetical protein
MIMSATRQQIDFYNQPASEFQRDEIRKVAAKANVDADQIARELFKRPVCELTRIEAGVVEGHIRKMMPPREKTNCFHCGLPNWSDAIEHVWCREAMTIGEYNRAHRNSF